MKLFEKLKEFRIGPVKAANYLNKGVLRNIIYLIFAIALFFFGVLVYGIILNLRNVPLSEAMLKNGFTEIKNPRLVVDRQNYTLGLYEESVLIKNYRVSFGKSVHTPKSRAGDKATPVGVYKICKIDTVNKYHKFFQINYPNLEDATNALRKGWISQKEFNDIKFQYYYEGCTRFNNILGGNIGIHGIGELDYV
ncbi:MAG: L,D-transpeptidase family protein, partial [Psychromonas sp.]|nr:L,D-transpeptidase family protein [Psychromonas sp.]